jgi:hypothetical protein
MILTPPHLVSHPQHLEEEKVASPAKSKFGHLPVTIGQCTVAECFYDLHDLRPGCIAATRRENGTGRNLCPADRTSYRPRCAEHDPEKACPGRDPGWVPVFGKIMLQQ